ncbi:MAG: hypothetical protein ACOCQG_03885 [Candidatus Nanoarchaeia archaeon]
MQKKRKKTRESNLKDKLTEYKTIFRFCLVALLLLLGLWGRGFVNEQPLFLLRLSGIILFVTYIGLSFMKFEEIDDKIKLRNIVFGGKVSLFVFGMFAIFVSLAGEGRILDLCPSEIVSFIILLLMAVFFSAVFLNEKLLNKKIRKDSNNDIL